MSRHEIQIALSALDDLHLVEDHISEYSPVAAHKMRQKIMERIKALADFPRIGKSAETLGFVDVDLRFVAQGKYYIFYTVTETHVEIRRIVHSARNIGALLAEFDFREFVEPEDFDNFN
jgi:plasmid stabilization system protein ParE